MYQRVHGAERAVAVAADAQPRPVDVAQAIELVDDGRKIVAEVVDVIVVHSALRTDDRHVGLNDGISLRDEKFLIAWRRRVELVPILRPLRPVISSLIGVLERIEPEERGQPCALLVITRQRDVDEELVAVGARDEHALPHRLTDLRRVVLVVRELRDLTRLHVAHVGIRHHRRRLTHDDRAREIVVERRGDALIGVGGAREQTIFLSGLDFHSVDERTRRAVRPRVEILRPRQIRVVAIGREQGHLGNAMPGLRHHGAWILIEGHGISGRAASTTTAAEPASA